MHIEPAVLFVSKSIQNYDLHTASYHYVPNMRIFVVPSNDEFSGLPKCVTVDRTIFGRTRILKVNESENFKTSKVKILLWASIFAGIVIALCFGILFSLDLKLFRIVKKANQNVQKTEITETKKILCDCEPLQVCLKVSEDAIPECKDVTDQKDPTGCGGLCRINEEYCKKIDSRVHQCRTLVKLNCSREQFNCGNRCVSMKMRCDGVINCSNSVDEKNCDCNTTTHFSCGNSTSCLHRNKWCDGIVDCWDDFDEIYCGYSCPPGKVPCRNGQCINKEYFCDGEHQCMDKSDEFRGCDVLR